MLNLLYLLNVFSIVFYVVNSSYTFVRLSIKLGSWGIDFYRFKISVLNSQRLLNTICEFKVFVKWITHLIVNGSTKNTRVSRLISLFIPCGIRHQCWLNGFLFLVFFLVLILFHLFSPLVELSLWGVFSNIFSLLHSSWYLWMLLVNLGPFNLDLCISL